MADAQTCEVEATLAPLNKGSWMMYDNTYSKKIYVTFFRQFFCKM
jgi:hypothetical protein